VPSNARLVLTFATSCGHESADGAQAAADAINREITKYTAALDTEDTGSLHKYGADFTGGIVHSLQRLSARLGGGEERGDEGRTAERPTLSQTEEVQFNFVRHLQVAAVRTPIENRKLVAVETS
jgi:hypothetical protein